MQRTTIRRVAIRALTLATALVTGLAAATDASPTLRGQSPPAATASRAAFEVASIKPNKAAPGLRIWRPLPGGRFMASNMPLRELIRLAYGADTFRIPAQMEGGPGWVGSDRFDIEAKAEHEDATARDMLAMLRTLLEDRFKLKAHSESRELPIYRLVLAKKDGSLGPQLTRPAVECVRAGAPPPADGKETAPRCGVTSPAPGVLIARGVTMAQVAAYLPLFPVVGRIVRDETALTGAFDLKLEYTPALVQGPNPGAFVTNPDADSGVSLFTAMQEQLGLKLDAQKGPVDVLVIDHVEPLADDKP
jgi:uncharacterized protein (TIGR03435 family)